MSDFMERARAEARKRRGIEASREAHARELVRELDRIDKELGND